MARNKNYTEEFKLQIAELNKTGKSVSEVARDYDLAKSTVSKWVRVL